MDLQMKYGEWASLSGRLGVPPRYIPELGAEAAASEE